MPTPERLEFFDKYQAIISPLIARENARRERRGFEKLSEQEIDAAIDEMMRMVSAKQDIKGYQFTTPTQQTKPQRQPETQDKFQFEIMKCTNGFLLNVTNQGKKEPYIFKNNLELSEIFERIFFSNLISRREKKNDGKNRQGHNPEGQPKSGNGKLETGVEGSPHQFTVKSFTVKDPKPPKITDTRGQDSLSAKIPNGSNPPLRS